MNQEKILQDKWAHAVKISPARSEHEKWNDYIDRIRQKQENESLIDYFSRPDAFMDDEYRKNYIFARLEDIYKDRESFTHFSDNEKEKMFDLFLSCFKGIRNTRGQSGKSARAGHYKNILSSRRLDNQENRFYNLYIGDEDRAQKCLEQLCSMDRISDAMTSGHGYANLSALIGLSIVVVRRGIDELHTVAKKVEPLSL